MEFGTAFYVYLPSLNLIKMSSFPLQTVSLGYVLNSFELIKTK
jgi:hypothetical protein